MSMLDDLHENINRYLNVQTVGNPTMEWMVRINTQNYSDEDLIQLVQDRDSFQLSYEMAKSQIALFSKELYKLPYSNETLKLLADLLPEDACDDCITPETQFAQYIKEKRNLIWREYPSILPKNLQKVEVVIEYKNSKKHAITIAQYVAPKSVLEEGFMSEDYDCDEFCEYDEEKDCYWVPTGFFEHQIMPEVNWFISEKVILWRPSPALPEIDLEMSEDETSSLSNIEKKENQVSESKYIPLCVLYTLWDLFGKTPVDKDECIERDFLDFKNGTSIYHIWHWFEQSNPRFIVDEVLKGKRVTE